MKFSRVVLNSNGPWCLHEEKRKFVFFFWCFVIFNLITLCSCFDFYVFSA